MNSCGLEGTWPEHDPLHDTVRKLLQKAITVITDNPTTDWSDSQITVIIPGNGIIVTAGTGQHQYTIGLDGQEEPFVHYNRVTESICQKMKRTFWDYFSPPNVENERSDSANLTTSTRARAIKLPTSL